jgi:hypothetical protein
MASETSDQEKAKALAAAACDAVTKVFAGRVNFCIMIWPMGASPSQQMMMVGNTDQAARIAACAAAVERTKRR